MVGAWNSLAIAWPAVLLGAAIGTAIGCAAAAWRWWPSTTTASPQAQAYFDQGLKLTWAFNHAEARRAFRALLDDLVRWRAVRRCEPPKR